MAVLGLVFFPIAVETLIIKADPSAPKNQQPIILQTASGLPQVNIQTPNDKGLSHNKYAKFDVAEKGAILNNSRKAVQTQQGGWVQGNPYLVRGEAKAILNEVNSSDPSVLKGYAAPEQKPPLIMDSPIPEDGRDARILPSPIPEENKDITSGGGYQPIDPELFPVTIDSRIVDLPVPEKKQVKTPDGKILDYQSHTKHTRGGDGNTPEAGLEPRNSLELFEKSIQQGKKRYAIDSEGRIHQFHSNYEGTLWHWLVEQEKINLKNKGCLHKT